MPGPWDSAGLPAPDWSEATRHLAERDPTLAALIRRVGPCRLAPRPNSFGTLVGSIVSQQISNAAARTVHRRLWALTRGEPPTPRDLLRRRETTLRRVGLSRQKIGYLRDLAARVESGELDLAAFAHEDDDAIRAALTSVRGVGDWTVDMYLIFTLNRPDVFAGGDAAVVRAMRDLYELPEDAKLAACERIADRWRPFRSVGVWYMYEQRRLTRDARQQRAAPTRAAPPAPDAPG